MVNKQELDLLLQKYLRGKTTPKENIILLDCCLKGINDCLTTLSGYEILLVKSGGRK